MAVVKYDLCSKLKQCRELMVLRGQKLNPVTMFSDMAFGKSLR